MENRYYENCCLIDYLENNNKFEEAYEVIITNRKKILKTLKTTDEIKKAEEWTKEFLSKNLRLYNNYEELIEINDPFILKLKNYSEYDIPLKKLNSNEITNCLNKINLYNNDTSLNKLKKEYLILELEIIREYLKKVGN